MAHPDIRRRCALALNSFHSILYFAPELGAAFAASGVTDDTAVYLACRAAPLGAVGPGAVAGLFNAFATPMLARHLPDVWQEITPAEAVAARLRAADAVLRRLLGAESGSAAVAKAAEVARAAAEACGAGGRPMGAANAGLPVPAEPHLALFHAATMLREYRGDGHVAVLGCAGLAGLDALVTHCATPDGMPKQIVIAKRGWTEDDWSRSERGLCERGLMDLTGALTTAGTDLRAEVERETDRLDRSPYDHIGLAWTRELAELTERLVEQAADAFPPPLREFFVPAALSSSPGR